MSRAHRPSSLRKPINHLFSLTPAAKNRIRQLVVEHKKPKAAIRVGVKKGGCSGYTYTMEFTDRFNNNDEVIVDEDVTVVVDEKAAFALVGTQMDYVTSKLKSEFVFNNPNSRGTCGCGESFSLFPNSNK